MNADNKRALKFYLKLGFTILDFDDELQTEELPQDVLILVRTL